jgi:hypothetical protein
MVHVSDNSKKSKPKHALFMRAWCAHKLPAGHAGRGNKLQSTAAAIGMALADRGVGRSCCAGHVRCITCLDNCVGQSCGIGLRRIVDDLGGLLLKRYDCRLHAMDAVEPLFDVAGARAGLHSAYAKYKSFHVQSPVVSAVRNCCCALLYTEAGKTARMRSFQDRIDAVGTITILIALSSPAPESNVGGSFRCCDKACVHGHCSNPIFISNCIFFEENTSAPSIHLFSVVRDWALPLIA